MQENMVRMQQEAQYFAMEKETPVYITTEEVIFIADPAGNDELIGAFNEARASLGLEPMADDASNDGDHDSAIDVEEGDRDNAEGDEVDEDDDDDVGMGSRIQTLLTQLRATYPDWPGRASMMVVGSFTPTGGTAQPFRVYFEAEIEVESALNPPVVVDSASAGIRVELRPDQWFKRTDGTVWNLAALDFVRTGQLVEFENEFEHGIEAHHDDDHDGHD